MELWAGQGGAGDGDESVAGTGARLEREGYNKGLEQGDFREEVESGRGWGVEELTGK